MTEVAAGALCFTRITDHVLRPMTLALCTASARVPSYAASLVLREIEGAIARMAYAGATGGNASSRVQPQPPSV